MPELHSAQIINAPAQSAVWNTPTDSFWTNTSGASMYLREINIWMGLDAGIKADFGAEAWRVSPDPTRPRMLLTPALNWDHYEDCGNAMGCLFKTTAPGNDYWLIKPGEQIELTGNASAFEYRVYDWQGQAHWYPIDKNKINPEYQVGLSIAWTIVAP